MTENIGKIIAASCSLGMVYTQRLLKDVSSAQFARLASPGGQTVFSNHPAFVLGHLSLYPSRIVEQLEEDASAIQPPERFYCLFSKDATCQDDPDGTIYPTMDAVVDRYYTGYQTAIELLRRSPDDKFLRPNPAEGPLSETFPTLGAMQAFYAGGHLMAHLGQLSAWRRMMGLAAA